MNLALYFEGTGQGVHGKYTNVTRLYEATREAADLARHLEAGPGTHFGAYFFGKAMGVDAQAILTRARRWFEAHHRTSDRVFLFGFSRGALLARHFAAWLDKLGVEVTYLGLWDTVDSTVRLDVSETCPPNVRRARHAVARDEHRRHFDYVPLTDAAPPRPPRPARVEEMLFPGSHSDVGGLYEDNHAIADVSLNWIAEPAAAAGLALTLPAPEKVTPKIHNSLRMVSNLFGLLGRIERRVGTLARHHLCDKM